MGEFQMRKITILVLLAALLTSGIVYSWNPVVSEEYHYGCCHTTDPVNHEIEMDDTIITVPGDQWESVEVGEFYLYEKTDYLFGEDKIHFEHI
jgi:hypothetical protein